MSKNFLAPTAISSYHCDPANKCLIFNRFINKSNRIPTKFQADRAADIHRETMKKKRRELEQVSLDAASDLLDTDSNATFAMVKIFFWIFLQLFFLFQQNSIKIFFLEIPNCK